RSRNDLGGFDRGLGRTDRHHPNGSGSAFRFPLADHHRMHHQGVRPDRAWALRHHQRKNHPGGPQRGARTPHRERQLDPALLAPHVRSHPRTTRWNRGWRRTSHGDKRTAHRGGQDLQRTRRQEGEPRRQEGRTRKSASGDIREDLHGKSRGGVVFRTAEGGRSPQGEGRRLLVPGPDVRGDSSLGMGEIQFHRAVFRLPRRHLHLDNHRQPLRPAKLRQMGRDWI
ncbi:uncharacterized protein METZ01_LOCUS464019, partial [marine metagenome]